MQSFSPVRSLGTSQPNAFDEAVKGVEGIAHTASPFYLDAQTHDELLKPAIEGTVNVMRSALKYKYVPVWRTDLYNGR